MWRKSTGLMDFQQEVIDCKDKFIILNWCRNASKTFTLAKLLEYKKPKNVIYVGQCPSDYYDFYEFRDKLDTFTKLEIDYSNETIGNEIFTSVNGERINLFSNTYDKLDKDLVYDYIIYDDILTYDIGFKANVIISTITYNNYDKWIQRFFPTAKVFEIDYKFMSELGMLNYERVSNTEKVNTEKYFNEYAILDNPFNIEKEKVIIACDFPRSGMYGDFSEMILKYDKEMGYMGYVINYNSSFRISSEEVIKVKDKVDYLKETILFYNGKRAKDYENIDMILIDSGASGSSIIYSDYLLEDWIDKEEINHVGIIDKTSEIYEGYDKKFPNAIDKLRLISPKNTTRMREELMELIEDRVIQFDVMSDNDISKNTNVLMLAHRLYELRTNDNKIGIK